MKTLFISAAVVAAMLCASCGTQKQVQTQNVASKDPIGNLHELTIAETTDADFFGATGVSYGARIRKDMLQLNALRSAQKQIREQMAYAYKGVIEDYALTMGNNVGMDFLSKVEDAGKIVIDKKINEVSSSSKPQFSDVDDKGNIECYISIRISKKELADEIKENLKESVPEAQKMEIDFRHDAMKKEHGL